MALCEHAHRHEDTGRHSLLGLFDRVVLPAVPAPHPSCDIYVCLTNLHGSYALVLQVVRAADEFELVQVHLQGDVKIADPLRSSPQGFRFPRGVPVPSYGAYLARLLANGRSIHEMAYDVAPPPRSPR